MSDYYCPERGCSFAGDRLELCQHYLGAHPEGERAESYRRRLELYTSPPAAADDSPQLHRERYEDAMDLRVRPPK